MIVFISLLRLSSCQVHIYFNFFKLSRKKSALCNQDKKLIQEKARLPPASVILKYSCDLQYSIVQYLLLVLTGWTIPLKSILWMWKRGTPPSKKQKLTSALRCFTLLKCRNNIWSSTSTNCWTALAALQTTALSDGVFNTSRRHSVHI